MINSNISYEKQSEEASARGTGCLSEESPIFVGMGEVLLKCEDGWKAGRSSRLAKRFESDRKRAELPRSQRLRSLKTSIQPLAEKELCDLLIWMAKRLAR